MATAARIPITPATPRRIALVAAGGALGSTTRWAVGEAIVPTHGVPWALLVVNLVGSAVLALALAESGRVRRRAGLLVDFVGTGFCGGLTTFSSLAVATAKLTRDGRPGVGLGFLAGSVIAGIVLAALVSFALSESRS